jgi:hypothetical protein
MASMMASRMASKKAEGMLAPLLSDEDSTTGSDTDDSDASSKVETVKKSPMQKLKTLIVYIGLGGGVAASAASMVFAPFIATFVMGAICIANVPYSAIKERHMGKIPSLRAMNNKLRDDANNLEDAVDDLSEEIDLLEPEADRAAACEEELRAIAEQQEVNVNKLVELVKENAVILAQMRVSRKTYDCMPSTMSTHAVYILSSPYLHILSTSFTLQDNLRSRIVQDIITIVVKSDKDNDQTIDKSEAKTLALRIRLSLQEYGVQFDSDKFLKAIGNNPSVPGVIAIVQKLLPKPSGDDDDDETYDSDADSCDSEEDDIYDMFYMADDDVRTSVGGAGTSMTGSGSGGLSLMTCDRKKSTASRSEMVKGKSNRGAGRRTKWREDQVEF